MMFKKWRQRRAADKKVRKQQKERRSLQRKEFTEKFGYDHQQGWYKTHEFIEGKEGTRRCLWCFRTRPSLRQKKVSCDLVPSKDEPK